MDTSNERKLTILLVDDDPVQSKMLREELQDEGFHVLRAFDGEEGLKLARSKKPDLVLLDIIIPKLDGISVLKKLKEDSVTKAIPVIMLTNLDTSREAFEALELGITEYLVKKNYTLEELTEKVREVLK